MATSRDPLTAAVTAILKPGVRDSGFCRIMPRAFGRIRNDILQWFWIEVSPYGTRAFSIPYSSKPLFVPNKFAGGGARGSFPRGKSDYGAWPGRTEKLANESMHEVVAIFQAEVLQWFDQTTTPDKILEQLEPLSQARNGHIQFERATCYAQLGNTQNALSYLKVAVKQYQAAHQEMPSREWCVQGMENCVTLQTAIEDGRCRELLDKWIAQSKVEWKLSRIKNGT